MRKEKNKQTKTITSVSDETKKTLHQFLMLYDIYQISFVYIYLHTCGVHNHDKEGGKGLRRESKFNNNGVAAL